jgi:exoribonuclease R
MALNYQQAHGWIDEIRAGITTEREVSKITENLQGLAEFAKHHLQGRIAASALSFSLPESRLPLPMWAQVSSIDIYASVLGHQNILLAP